MRALIVVDMQNSFIEGSLSVPGAKEIVPLVNGLMRAYSRVVLTQDWHPWNHSSFKDQGGQWPAHCVRDTVGADLVRGLNPPADAVHVFKGEDQRAGYSAFEAAAMGSALHGARAVDVVGVAFDYCVFETAMDADKSGFDTRVLIDATRPVEASSAWEAYQCLRRQGVEVC